MQAEQEETLSRTFASILEKQAFLFAEPVEKTELAVEGFGLMQARMAFSGHWRGTLTLAVPEALCPEIAANMLGNEPDDEKAISCSQDALKELLNVVCGSLLIALAGEKPVFDLFVPEVSSLSDEACRKLLDDPETLSFQVDEKPVLLRFWIGDK